MAPYTLHRWLTAISKKRTIFIHHVVVITNNNSHTLNAPNWNVYWETTGQPFTSLISHRWRLYVNLSGLHVCCHCVTAYLFLIINIWKMTLDPPPPSEHTVKVMCGCFNATKKSHCFSLYSSNKNSNLTFCRSRVKNWMIWIRSYASVTCSSLSCKQVSHQHRPINKQKTLILLFSSLTDRVMKVCNTTQFS